MHRGPETSGLLLVGEDFTLKEQRSHYIKK